jgi:hypothetical protein
VLWKLVVGEKMGEADKSREEIFRKSSRERYVLADDLSPNLF